ncbi:MAG: molybdopterin cofactor-binding domain-containing protein, partial [Terracidiphilus sp.]
MANKIGNSTDVFGATLTRRGFVKKGGVLAIGFSLVGTAPLRGDTPKPAFAKNSLDPSLPTSWLEIHPDNTVLIRTGKSDFGQGTVYTAYRQIVAEELSMPFESITTVVAGDTDRTPD